MHPSLIDLSLDRTERLLAALGNPEQALPNVVHVAGTNGKGSFLAFLRAIYEAAGLTVHAYTSPHLVQFGERIVVSGNRLDDPSLVKVLEECEAANAGQEITFFEVTTAAAFLAFSRSPADVTLLETGLGGRFDATNVIDRPALTAITPVSMDHMRFLGDTLSEIAFEKAGILKPGVPALISPQQPEAFEVISRRAEEIGADLITFGKDWFFESKADGLSVRDGDETIPLPFPNLIGDHQHMNAAMAVIAAQQARGFSFDHATLARGIQTAIWPARMQRLDHGKLVETLPDGWEVWLDGGHNQAAGKIIADTAAGWKDRPLMVIFGALNTRDPGDFLEQIEPLADHLICITIPDEASALEAEAVRAAAETKGITAECAATLEEAMALAAGNSTQPGRILVCGSLYLAGAFLSANETPP